MSRKIPLSIQPGVVKTESPYSQRGRYIDTDKIVFRNGRPEKWKGSEFFAGPVEGIPRNIRAWDDFSINRWIAIGSHNALTIVDKNGDLIDATPFRATGSLTDPFTTTMDSAVVTVEDTGHLAQRGDEVYFSGATAVGGITIDGGYEVASLIDADHYTIVHSVAATSGASGGGTVGVSYEIYVGSINVTIASGWGTGTWGTGTWGTPRDNISTATRYPRVWALELAGENLYALPSGERLYQWDPDVPATRAQLVANSPSGLWMFMTSEGFPIILGVDGDLMTIAWPDQNDHTDWTPAQDNTCIFRALPYGNRLIAGTSLRSFSNLIWTDTHCYVHQYTGAYRSVYTTLPVGANCGLVGPKAFAIDSTGNAYWMSNDTFFMYDGQVRPIPRVFDIQDWLFARMHPQQRFKTTAIFLPETNQVRWFYIVNLEPEFYVDVSLEDFSWTVGTYRRTAMSRQSGVNAKLYSVDKDGNLYTENTGLDEDGAAMPFLLETAPIDVDDGNRLIDIQGFVPDCQRQTGAQILTITTWDQPMVATPMEVVQQEITEGQGIVDFYASGRQISFKIEGVELGCDFRLGQPRLEVVDETQAKRR